MFKFSEFKPCASELPEKDGAYLVIRMFNGRLAYAAALDYTTEWGWNTSKYAHESPINFNDNDHLDKMAYWAEVTKE